MSVTVLMCCAYMWYTQVPHFPFGDPRVRVLLLARGIGGFFGVYGMYCMSLPIWTLAAPWKNLSDVVRLFALSPRVRSHGPDFPGSDAGLLGVFCPDQGALFSNRADCWSRVARGRHPDRSASVLVRCIGAEQPGKRKQ